MGSASCGVSTGCQVQCALVMHFRVSELYLSRTKRESLACGKRHATLLHYYIFITYSYSYYTYEYEHDLLYVNSIYIQLFCCLHHNIL